MGLKRCFVNLNKCNTLEWIAQSGYVFNEKEDCYIDHTRPVLWGVCYDEIIMLPARITSANMLDIHERRIFHPDWEMSLFSRLNPLRGD